MYRFQRCDLSQVDTDNRVGISEDEVHDHNVHAIDKSSCGWGEVG